MSLVQLAEEEADICRRRIGALAGLLEAGCGGACWKWI